MRRPITMVTSARAQGLTSPALTDARGTSKWTTDGDAFTGVELASYWSEDKGDSASTWVLDLDTGLVASDDRFSTNKIWPVRAISEIDTTCIGNQSPIPDAGDPQNVLSGQLVQLDGTGSVDSDGDDLTYQWQQISGPIIELSGPSTAQPTFIAPAENGVVLVRLTVSDGCSTASDEVEVFVTVPA